MWILDKIKIIKINNKTHLERWQNKKTTIDQLY